MGAFLARFHSSTSSASLASSTCLDYVCIHRSIMYLSVSFMFSFISLLCICLINSCMYSSILFIYVFIYLFIYLFISLFCDQYHSLLGKTVNMEGSGVWRCASVLRDLHQLRVARLLHLFTFTYRFINLFIHVHNIIRF